MTTMTEALENMPEHPNLDVLQHVLDNFQFEAQFFANPHLCNAWQISFDGQQALFHVIGQGQCYAHIGDHPPHRLQQGDIIMIIHPQPHHLSSAVTRAPTDFFTTEDQPAAPVMLICGTVRLDNTGPNILLESLPDFFVIPRQQAQDNLPLRTLIELLTNETRQQQSGSKVVLDRLSAALFVMILRHHLRFNATPTGFAGAIADRRLQPVLLALHQNLGHNWQVDELAQLACMSRSSFAVYFKEKLGMSPGTYMTAWRMTKARQLLKDQRNSVTAIAEQLGYASEAAFRRAFKRFCGEGPGLIRREARHPPPQTLP